MIIQVAASDRAAAVTQSIRIVDGYVGEISVVELTPDPVFEAFDA